MKIYGLKDLEHYKLQVGDVVIFHVKNEHGKFIDLKYEVHSDFLMNIDDISDALHSYRNFNDEIFTILELNPYEFCSKYYGYKSNDGVWPCYKEWDFEAATNVVKALYTVIDTMKMLPSFKTESHIDMIWNGKEFGYNDSDGGWKRIDVDSSISYSNPGTSNSSITSAASTPLRFMTQGTTSCRHPGHTSLLDMPIDKLKKIASQIKTIKEDNNSKLKGI